MVQNNDYYLFMPMYIESQKVMMFSKGLKVVRI